MVPGDRFCRDTHPAVDEGLSEPSNPRRVYHDGPRNQAL